MEPKPASLYSFLVPLAILVGFALLALAIYFTGDRAAGPTGVATNTSSSTPTTLSSRPRPIDGSDYVRGNPNAPILLVEYSDYDCPFCKQYHATLSRIMDEYGISGKVAWVYRQFPIQQLHPNSPKISEAALCVGSLGGNDAFWKFTDQVFEEREIDEFTNMIALPEYAVTAGVDRNTFVDCMNNDSMQGAVKKSVEDAFNIGARGTPYTVLMVGTEQAVINGNQSYETVKGILENILKQLDGNFDPNASVATST